MNQPNEPNDDNNNETMAMSGNTVQCRGDVGAMSGDTEQYGAMWGQCEESMSRQCEGNGNAMWARYDVEYDFGP